MRTVIGCCLVGALVAGCASRSQAPAMSTPDFAVAEQKFTISGRAVSGEDGSALAGLPVLIIVPNQPPHGHPAGPDVTRSPGELLGRTTTDDTGAFAFAIAPSGVYMDVILVRIGERGETPWAGTTFRIAGDRLELGTVRLWRDGRVTF